MREMQLADVRLTPNRVTIRPETLQIENGSGATEEIRVLERASAVREILDQKEELPPAVRQVLLQLDQFFSTTDPFGVEAEQGVEAMMDALVEAAPAHETDYADGTDPVIALKEMLAIEQDDEPPQPNLIPLDAIHPADIEVRRRENEKRLRWVNARGAASRKFSLNIKSAYNSRCIMCGLRFASGRYCQMPGVDAAHILAWRNIDLDVVSNGVCLCKIHHWAFDAYMLSIVPGVQDYSIVLTQSARHAYSNDTSVFQFLSSAVGVVPKQRLPVRQQDWPNPTWLSQRNEELGVVPSD